MKSLPTLAAAAALFLGLSAPAAAAEVAQLGVVGGWTIGSDGKSCIGSMIYENDAALSFIMGADGGAGIVVQNERWNIPKGEYRVWVGVDRAAPGEFQGRANGDMVFMPWVLRSDQVEMVSRGAVMRFSVGRETLSFRLDGSAAMLSALGRCAAERMQTANPFAGAPSAPAPANPFAETTTNPYRRM